MNRQTPADAPWLDYQHSNGAWAYFRLQGTTLELAQGHPGTAKEWSESFDSKAEADARVARVVALLEAAEYALVGTTNDQPAHELGDCPEDPIEEVELDEALAAAEAEDAVLWREFYEQSQSELRPSARAPDGGELAARLLDRVASLRGRDGIKLMEASFGEPASEKALADTEEVLGIKLPPSLRRYLAVQDGAEIAVQYPELDPRGLCNLYLSLCGTTQLQEEYRGLRDWPRVAEGELMAHLRPISGFHGNHLIALDTRVVSESGEYAVVTFENGWTPGDYTRVSPDFASFVATMIEDFFMLRHEHPPARFDNMKRALQELTATQKDPGKPPRL